MALIALSRYAFVYGTSAAVRKYSKSLGINIYEREALRKKLK